MNISKTIIVLKPILIHHDDGSVPIFLSKHSNNLCMSLIKNVINFNLNFNVTHVEKLSQPTKLVNKLDDGKIPTKNDYSLFANAAVIAKNSVVQTKMKRFRHLIPRHHHMYFTMLTNDNNHSFNIFLSNNDFHCLI